MLDPLVEAPSPPGGRFRLSGVYVAMIGTCVALLCPAAAGAAGSSKYAVLSELGDHASSMHMDLLQNQQASLAASSNANDPTTSCIGDIADIAHELADDLGELSDLGVLTDLMARPSDRYAVLRVLRIQAARDIKIIDSQRELLNKELGGYCSATLPVVATKAQALLDFMQTAKDRLGDAKLGLLP